MYGHTIVEAESLEDALLKSDEAPLPDGTYVTDSFQIDNEMVSEDYSEEWNLLHPPPKSLEK